MVKLIHRELSKKMEFDHMNKWYMHNPKSILENETDKLLRSFETETYHLISSRGTDLVVVINKKETLPISWLRHPGKSQSKIKRKRKQTKVHGPWLRTKMLWNMKVTVIPIVIGAFRTISNVLVRGLTELEFWGGADTIQTPALLRLARILRQVQEIWAELLPLRLQWNTIC